MHGGIDLNLETQFPSTPAQMESMYPMYEGNDQEPNPVPLSIQSPNMNTQFHNPSFVPNMVKPENYPTVNGINWEIPNGQIGMDKMQFNIGGDRSGSSQVQLNGMGNVVEPSNFGLGSGGGSFYQQNPCQVAGGFNMGTNNTIARNYQLVQFDEETLEKRQRRLIKNRESAARSRARRLAYNAQQVIEIDKLRKENEILRKMLKSFMTVTKNRYEKLQRGNRRALSAPVETEE